jgi:hypothetical protein
MADTPKSVYVVAREIAVRLERAGENPHSDQPLSTWFWAMAAELARIES